MYISLMVDHSFFLLEFNSQSVSVFCKDCYDAKGYYYYHYILRNFGSTHTIADMLLAPLQNIIILTSNLSVT
eukprot:scaffold14281_cov68-Attheya_sp.AAC.2